MTGTPPSTVAEVVARMQQIDAGLDPRDGVACFNRMYRMFTELVEQRLTDGFFSDRPFVDRMDVIFAGIYFEAIDAAGAGKAPDPSWRPLFEARSNRVVWPIQFALAGMNAHINHDLALAVVATCKERSTTPDTPPVHSDYLKVNELLAQAEAPVRQSYETQLLRMGTAPVEPLVHIVSSFSIARARDGVWCNTRTLWSQRNMPLLYQASVATMAQSVGLAGRLLVTPVIPPPPDP
jgi:uncharacterized protein DUF5995